MTVYLPMSTVPEITPRSEIRCRRTGPANKQLPFASAYMQYDATKSPPPREVGDLVKFAAREGLELVISCDEKAHNMVWGSSDTKGRGKSLLDFIFYN